MKRIDCNKAEEQILRDLDSSLDGKERSLLKEHLKRCPQCRRFREEMRSTLEALAEDQYPDPGEQYWTNYRVSLEARLSEKDPGSRSGLLWKAVGATFAAAAACLLIWTAVWDSGHAPLQDRAETLAVFQELLAVYGPTLPEVDLAASDSAENGCVWIPIYRDMRLSWFEVEDETDQLLM